MNRLFRTMNTSLFFTGATCCTGILVAAMLWPAGALNAQSHDDEDIRACREIDAPMERLACYDRVTGGPLNQPVVDSQTKQNIPSGERPAGTAATGRDIFGLGDRARREEPSEISVLIASHRRDPYGKWVFVTADGQVWKQTDNRRAFLRGEAIEATLKRSRFGTYSVILPNGNSFKVERLQ